MIAYVVRRVLYAIPTLLGVNVITFALFFVVNPPERMARRILGEKNVTSAQVETWLRDHDYDLPLLFNRGSYGAGKLTNTVFFRKSASLLWLDFGLSDRNNIAIGETIMERVWPSLAVTIPLFLLGLVSYVSAAMLLAHFRATRLDLWGAVTCVVMMSVPYLFLIISGQWLVAKSLRLFPISGYEPGLVSLRFAFLPILIGVISGIGSGTRFYRSIFIEELGRDHIRTARAKGLPEGTVLFRHALKNAMIPILTNTVTEIPLLFMGALLLESFFAIPGLGSFTIEAINAQDFAIVRAMVYLGSVLYIAGLILTDISYSVVDPRVRFK